MAGLEGDSTVLLEILKGAWQSFRETLPSTTDEAGPFLAGAAWAFVLHWTLLIAVTFAHCSRAGTC